MGRRRDGSAGRARVEVRRLAGGRALRVNGTFASFWRPGSALTGSVWDALAAPIAWLPPARRRKLLILGLGGGSAARLARILAPRAEIVGVEIDREVVAAARDAFELDRLGLRIVVDDARRFLARERRRFDAVIEDVFVGSGRHVHKPDWMVDGGLAAAARRVARGGLLVSNALDEGPAVARTLAPLFAARARIDVDRYDNRVYVGGPAGLSGRALRGAVASHPDLASGLAHLSFRSLGPG